MGMKEKKGGKDVREKEKSEENEIGGEWRIKGNKWLM